ncbi:hypothetical protein [Levilactobacillus angrenensis]|nr:hypothetical protein [Levilactobacillus angrenensis]
MKFSAKKLTVKNYFDAYGRKKSKRVMTLHAAKSSLNYRQGLSNKKFKQHLVSAFAANGSYTQVTPYGFLATDGLGKYKVIHKTYKGKSVKVLYNNLNDDHFKVKDHFYQTKAQAKYFNPVGALHK